jgi:H+/Cl- antiporter ClcA
MIRGAASRPEQIGDRDMAAASDPFRVVRTRGYLGLLMLAAVLGAPIAAAAYWFLKLTALLQGWVFTDLPTAMGFQAEPIWWPVGPLAVAGVLVGLTIRYLPGGGGESPADGFKAGGVAQPLDLPGIVVAALAGIGLGVVVGPEAPLIALGGGLAFLAVWLVNRDVPARAAGVVAAAGSFAAVSTLFGSPLAAAFLLMEAIGLGGSSATIVLVPGLLGAGIGALIFTGLDSLTGYGPFSLAIPNLPPAGTPTAAELGWAVVIGLAAAPSCWAIRRLALTVRPLVAQRTVPLTTAVGLLIAGLAIAYGEGTGKPTSDVLFSGQSALPVLIDHSAAYSVGTLGLLLACKGLAYAGALSSFRGGPTFPAMFLGAAGGMALSHLPGLPLIPGVAMGIGAMTAGILKLPLTAVLLTSLFLGSDGITVMPLVIVAVVVSYVVTIRINRPPETSSESSRTRW